MSIRMATETLPDGFRDWPREAQRAWITSLRAADINDLILEQVDTTRDRQSPQFHKDQRAAILIALL